MKKVKCVYAYHFYENVHVFKILKMLIIFLLLFPIDQNLSVLNSSSLKIYHV